jgi:hypothetical protein
MDPPPDKQKLIQRWLLPALRLSDTGGISLQIRILAVFHGIHQGFQ